MADTDNKQQSASRWNGVRNDQGYTPTITTINTAKVEDAVRNGALYDALVFDGKPASSKETLQIAKHCDLILLPTGYATDDLHPTVLLANDLKNHVTREKILFVFSRTGNSPVEYNDACEYIQMAGYKHCKNAIPEQTAYRRAQDAGKTLTEASHSTMIERAEKTVQEILDQISELAN